MKKPRTRLGEADPGDVWTVTVVPLSGEPLTRTLRLTTLEFSELVGNLRNLYEIGVLRDFQANRYSAGSLEDFMADLKGHLEQGWEL